MGLFDQKSSILDLIKIILGYLDTKDLCYIACVNKYLNNIISSQWNLIQAKNLINGTASHVPLLSWEDPMHYTSLRNPFSSKIAANDDVFVIGSYFRCSLFVFGKDHLKLLHVLPFNSSKLEKKFSFYEWKI